jgi:ribose 5-phosphate isomerase A
MDVVTAEDLKRMAAEQAVEQVRSGMVLGLGTGSTVAHFLELLAQRLRSGDLANIAGVPTSRWTRAQSERLGIPLTSLAAHEGLDLTVDGADEIDENLDLIKGMGGALLREKMVAQASDRVLIIADGGKRVAGLGTRSPLPVEVVPWAHEAQARFMERLGAMVTVREGEAGAEYRTDNGNVLLHCRFEGGISNPAGLETTLQLRAGIVATGLFLGIAHEALVASPEGVHVMRRTA